MRTQFLATTEGMLPKTALLYGFETSDPQGRFGAGRRCLSRIFYVFLML